MKVPRRKKKPTEDQQAHRFPQRVVMGLMPKIKAVDIAAETHHRPRPEELKGQVGTCGCGAWWTGQNTSHCTACHETFTGITAFDAHHRGGHKHPSTMEALALIDRAHGQKVWGYPDTSDPDAPKWYEQLKATG